MFSLIVLFFVWFFLLGKFLEESEAHEASEQNDGGVAKPKQLVVV